MGLLFTAAIVVAIVAVGVKRWQRGRAFRVSSKVEEDERPRSIATHADIADHLRCACGGKRIVEGEGPKRDVWRVVTRCGSCGNKRALLFRVGY